MKCYIKLSDKKYVQKISKTKFAYVTKTKATVFPDLQSVFDYKDTMQDAKSHKVEIVY